MVPYLRAPIVCALLAAALYAVTLNGTLIYDDRAILVADKRIADASLWYRYWTEGYNDGVDNLYRPLASMTYAIQHALHGETAWPYHLVNTLLHAIASAMVAWFAMKLATRFAVAGASAIGWLAGLLFAAHPVHVEAVANIVGRAELLCAIGTIGALGLMLEPLSPRRIIAIGALFLVALLSKEQGMLVPTMIGAFVLVDRYAPPSPCTPARARNTCPGAHGEAAPPQPLGSILFLVLAAPLAIYVVLKETVLKLKFWWDRSFLDPWIQPLAESTGSDRLLAPLSIVGRYFELLTLPHTLRIDYGGLIIPGVVRTDDPYFWLGIVGVIAWMTIVAIATGRKDRFTLLAALWFGIAYAIVGNILTIIGVNAAERLMYLPSAFFILIAARLLILLPKRAMVGLLAILVVGYSIRTVSYAIRWNDRLAFYEYQVRVEPRSMKAILLTLIEHQDRGDLASAERYARMATHLQPDYEDAALRLANVLIDQDRFDEAQRLLDDVQARHPQGKAPAYLNRLEERRAATRPSAEVQR